MNAEDAIEFSRSKLARDIARLLNGQSRTERRAILTMANNILDAVDREPLSPPCDADLEP